MNSLLRVLIICLIIPINYHYLFSQTADDLFQMRSYKKAIVNQSRTNTGVPGSGYWQNRSDYKIKANLNTELRKITGSEVISYENNSPDTLKLIYFNLVQDIYKKGVARDWDIGISDLHDGVNIEKMIIDEVEIDLKSKNVFHNSSIFGVLLSKAFAPKTKHQIEIDWSFTLSKTRNIRMGTYQDYNFMVGHWFPKVAVYDDVFGWANKPHTGNCEFYHEFGNYEVEITVPSTYMVWSSGLLQNADEIYTSKHLERIQQSKESDKIIPIISREDLEKGDILKKRAVSLWKFSATNLPDFAFAASDRYIWDATSVPNGKNRVSVNAVYNPNSIDFDEVAEISRLSIQYQTTLSPAIAFPYPQLVVFNGNGGMEFPGMVNDGDSQSRIGTLYVTFHEIGHSYFPFNTGLNEQSYAWMDEGLITFLPQEFIEMNDTSGKYKAYEDIVRSYNANGGDLMEMPLITASTNTGYAYRYMAYGKSSLALFGLYKYLGKDKFNAGLQEFTRRWAGKHPSPYDFFYTFDYSSGEDLAWFWKPWFFELSYADLSIGTIKNQQVEILNKGGLPLEVNMTITVDNQEIKIYKPANIWKNGVQQVWIDLPKGVISKIALDTKRCPDLYPQDNQLNI